MKIFRRVSTKLSLSLMLLMMIIMITSTHYLVKNATNNLKEANLEKGATYALTHAKAIGEILDNIIDNEVFTLNEMFNQTLIRIELPPYIVEKYASSKKYSPDLIKKYHYETSLDSYLENVLLSFQDTLFHDPYIEYAILSDKQGYVPVHNSKYNQPLSGNYEKDLKQNRTKRIFFDSVSQRLTKNDSKPFLQQEYQQDTGEIVWDISSPVYVKGQHWGAFRLGILINTQMIRDLQRKLITIMLLLLLISVIFVHQMTNFLLRHLQRLPSRMYRVGKGSLTTKYHKLPKDEIGDLARTFNTMVENLNSYVEKLKETIAEEEREKIKLKATKTTKNKKK
jgi:HAMP domain-containing protein